MSLLLSKSSLNDASLFPFGISGTGIKRCNVSIIKQADAIIKNRPYILSCTALKKEAVQPDYEQKERGYMAQQIAKLFSTWPICLISSSRL
jgi:hypothetical protein